MELAAWKRRRLIPSWGGNREEPEPCAILYHPPSVGWMSRWRELVLEAPTLDPKKLVERSTDADFAGSVKAWDAQLSDFRGSLLDDLIVAVEGLTLDGKAIDLAQAVEFIKDNEGLREEVFNAIIGAGTLASAEEKD